MAVGKLRGGGREGPGLVSRGRAAGGQLQRGKPSGLLDGRSSGASKTQLVWLWGQK